MRDQETIAEWATRLGFELSHVPSGLYRLKDKRSGVHLRGDFEELEEVATELRAREQ